ncbi:hypothetical protein EII35_15425 [Arachnia propionica]|uniref:Uncharacterized protein n=1 Tax=Arachnia propionica TaxID=1750 RepID=A0A3P1WLV3_9ACTN|nr:hypothetical protein EII35_15425 [Arachnia propionica]
MRHISFETAQTWIERLAGLPAPVRMEDIPGLAADFGWEPTKWDDEYKYEAEGAPQMVLVSANEETGEYLEIFFSLVKNRDGGLLGNAAVVDFLPGYVEAFSGVWGEPWSVMTDVETIDFIWKLHEQGYVELIAWPHSVACQFVTFDPTVERW